MKYSIINKDNSIYDIRVIRLNTGKYCFYWKNKGQKFISKVVIILNNANNLELKKDEIGLSLDGIKEEQDISLMLEILKIELQKEGINVNDITYKFIVDTIEEERKIDNISNKLNIQNREIDDNKGKKIEEKLSHQKELEAKDTGRTIVKQDENQYKKYYSDGNKVVDNNATLSIEQQKQKLLATWLNDAQKYQEIVSLSQEELDKKLTQAVLAQANLKEHTLDKPDAKTLTSNSANRSVEANKAISEDGSYNQELGIIKNNVSKRDEYSTVERNNGHVTINTPQTDANNIYTSNQPNTNFSTAYESQDVEINNQEKNKQEELEEVYYLDNSGIIYNKEGKIVGRNGTNGYIVDTENNLLKDNVKIGVIGDIHDLNRTPAESRGNSQAYSHVRVLKKPERPVYNNNNNKRAAFVTMPTIIFIISLLLLITSGIILLVMK